MRRIDYLYKSKRQTLRDVAIRHFRLESKSKEKMRIALCSAGSFTSTSHDYSRASALTGSARAFCCRCTDCFFKGNSLLFFSVVRRSALSVLGSKLTLLDCKRLSALEIEHAAIDSLGHLFGGRFTSSDIFLRVNLIHQLLHHCDIACRDTVNSKMPFFGHT